MYECITVEEHVGPEAPLLSSAMYLAPCTVSCISTFITYAVLAHNVSAQR